ncbi:MAG: choline dehydrogenase [Gammaproteobacteria bacterium]
MATWSVAGGSSSINGMLYVRGAAHRYDQWRDGNSPGWGFEELLPYFKGIEDRPQGSEPWRGHGGPLSVSDAKVCDPLSRGFMQACIDSGIEYNPDYNAERFEGVSWLQYTTRRGQRWSTARAFLRPAMQRSNLTLKTHALACRVVLEGRKAVGLTYRHEGREVQARARREVVLCAGPIVSPKLLELSGIGNGDILRQHGIEVVHHLPGVGENLQDHLQARVTYESRLKVTINDILNNPLRGVWAGLQYYLGRTGPLAQSVASVHALVRSSADLPHPDLKLQIMLYSGKDRYSRDKAAGLDPFSGFNIGAFQLYPHSTGNLHIRSADPEADPIIHANYLSDLRDQEVLLRGMRMVREISANPALSKLVVREVRPGPETANDDQWLDYIRDTAQTCWHPISTCRMGRGDRDVVDFELKVHGIEGLRVADSSIMPNMPTSNTNSTSIVIGRKGADLLRAANP